VRAPRIAVSGVGLVSALGQSAAETFHALMQGERGLRPLQLFDPGEVRSKLVGEVRGLSVPDIAPIAQREQFSRTDAMAVAAAREAVAAAGLPRGARIGVVLGGTTGGMFETEDLLSSPELSSLAPGRAGELVSYPLSASLARVADAVGGVSLTRSICSACSGGAIALVQAAAWLTRGEVDFVLAGGADGLCRLTLLGFNALGATDPESCRPFDRSRAGLNLGEGAAVLVLEREATALQRDAKVLAWLDGYAVGAEAHHITHPEPTGARASRLLRGALGRAGLSPAEVGYVNAHGTGTQQNDAMEARCLLDVFGADSMTWVSSCKAQLGHTLGAAGAIEAALTVMAVARGELPPGVGLVEPELPGLRHVGARGRIEPLTAAVSSSFGFGGMSCVLAFSERQRPAPPTLAPIKRVAVLATTQLDAHTPPEASLDAERSRRFDAASAMSAVGAAALGSLHAPSGAETGLVLGSAFGNVERTMAFLSRGRERGPRHVPPAEFPHLVPSAPAGNASVYAGLTGPVFAVSELAQSGEAAFAAACELIELGVATRLVAGAIAPRDAIVERVLGPLLDPSWFGAAARGQGAAFALLTELSEEARASGAALAEVLGRGTGELVLALARLPAPGPRTAVVLGVASADLRQALEASAWASAHRIDLATQHGYHEALGAVALAVATQLVTTGELDRVLVLSGTALSSVATLLGRADVEE
jgi:3-oxoacyl-[acyl-carrier-protein] synthase II